MQDLLDSLSEGARAHGASEAIAEYAANLQKLGEALDAGTISGEAFTAQSEKLAKAQNKSIQEMARRAFEDVMTPAEKAHK